MLALEMVTATAEVAESMCLDVSSPKTGFFALQLDWQWHYAGFPFDVVSTQVRLAESLMGLSRTTATAGDLIAGFQKFV